MKELVIICGKSASGKDSLLKAIIEKEPELFKGVVSYTTRPIRDNEVDGINYNFLTKEVFLEKVLSGDMLEAVEFNNWFYGSGIDSLCDDKINIGIYNPEGVELLLEHKDIHIIIFYVICTDKERLIRSLQREENPDVKEILRRFATDEKDFEVMEDLGYPYTILENEKEKDFNDNMYKIIRMIKTFFNKI